MPRLRFARLTQIRRLLGAKEDELELPFDASTFVVDDEYLILDLVLNWVSLGIVNVRLLVQVADGILLGAVTLRWRADPTSLFSRRRGQGLSGQQRPEQAS